MSHTISIYGFLLNLDFSCYKTKTREDITALTKVEMPPVVQHRSKNLVCSPLLTV